VARGVFELVGDSDNQEEFTTEPLPDSGVRIRLSDYYADIVCNRRSTPEIWHWIVQREGSTEILKWGQERQRSNAEAAARQYLRRMLERRKLRLIKGS
jgi:hypothetical protein